MRYLTLAQVLDLYRTLVKETGGALGIRDPKTKRQISDKPPVRYFPLLIEKSGPAAFEAQCIPANPALLVVDGYRSFLAERRKAVSRRLNEVSPEPAIVTRTRRGHFGRKRAMRPRLYCRRPGAERSLGRGVGPHNPEGMWPVIQAHRW